MWHELFLTLFADDPTWLREHMVDVISYEALTDHPTTAQDSTKGHIHMHQPKTMPSDLTVKRRWCPACVQ